MEDLSESFQNSFMNEAQYLNNSKMDNGKVAGVDSPAASSDIKPSASQTSDCACGRVPKKCAITVECGCRESNFYILLTGKDIENIYDKLIKKCPLCGFPTTVTFDFRVSTITEY